MTRIGTDFHGEHPWKSVSSVFLFLTAFATYAYLGRAHPFGTYATETDFYHYYQPDAGRIASGEFPENPFQGPGYPALLALVGGLTGDYFVAGKWISIVSAAGVVWLAYLLFARLFGRWAGVGAALLVAVSGEFPQFALNATTDAFFLLLCLACLVALLDERLGAGWRAGLAAALAGLAYLTRYNGVFLVAIGLLGIVGLDSFERPLKGRLRLAGLFLAVFLATVSPWLVANYRHRGSPFYNANYLNMATEYYPELAGGSVFQEGTRGLEDVFDSFGDVLDYDPARIARHYPANLWQSFRLSLNRTLVSPWVGWAALAGLALVIWERRSRAALLVVAAGLLYFLLLGLTHWEARYYFFVMVIYAGLAVYAAVRGLELLRARGWLRARAWSALPVALVALMWVSSAAFARRDVKAFLASHPREVLGACDYLRGAGVSGARIVARKPHLPAICGQEWVFFPPVKSTEELRAWLAEHPADYLTISSVEIKRRRELAALGDPQSAPPWLKPVWVSHKPLYILYQVVNDQ